MYKRKQKTEKKGNKNTKQVIGTATSILNTDYTALHVKTLGIFQRERVSGYILIDYVSLKHSKRLA